MDTEKLVLGKTSFIVAGILTTALGALIVKIIIVSVTDFQLYPDAIALAFLLFFEWVLLRGTFSTYVEWGVEDQYKFTIYRPIYMSNFLVGRRSQKLELNLKTIGKIIHMPPGVFRASRTNHLLFISKNDPKRVQFHTTLSNAQLEKVKVFLEPTRLEIVKGSQLEMGLYDFSKVKK